MWADATVYGRSGCGDVCRRFPMRPRRPRRWTVRSSVGCTETLRGLIYRCFWVSGGYYSSGSHLGECTYDRELKHGAYHVGSADVDLGHRERRPVIAGYREVMKISRHSHPARLQFNFWGRGSEVIGWHRGCGESMRSHISCHYVY